MDDASSSPSIPPQRSSKPRLPPSCEPTPPDALEQKVWVIFGGSTSLAHALIQTAISQNDLVASIAQSHEEENLDYLIPPPLLHSFNSTSNPQHPNTTAPSPTTPSTFPSEKSLLPLPCDIRIRESVQRAITAIISHFGRIDIIVNCCGYGVVAAAEDQDEYDIREQFEVNYFGVLNIVQCTLPYFRERWRRRRRGRSHQENVQWDTSRDEDRMPAESVGESEGMSEEASSGRKKKKRKRDGNDKGEAAKEGGGKYIFLNNSIAGGGSAGGVPGLAPYCAARAAVEGLVESMHYEVDELGVKCTLVETGLMMRGAGGNSEQELMASTVANNTTSATSAKDTSEVDDAHGRVNGHTTTTTANNTNNNSINILGTHPFTFKPPSAPYSSPTSPSGHARRILHLLSSSSSSSSFLVQHPPSTTTTTTTTSPTSNPPSPKLFPSTTNNTNNSSKNKTALLIHQLAHCKFPPLRLYLGTYAVEGVRDRLRVMGEEMDEWRWLNFPAYDGVGGEGGGKMQGIGTHEGGDGDGDGDGDGEDAEGGGDGGEMRR